MKRSIKATVSILLAGILLYAAVSRCGLPQTMAVIKAARPQLLLSGVLLVVLSFFLRSARWPIWERSLTNWNSVRLILIGFMGNNLLPARLAEILRAHYESARTSQDRRRTTALESIAAERILDGAMLAILAVEPGGNFLMQNLYGAVTTVAFKDVGGLGCVVVVLGSASKAMADACM